MAWSWTIGTLLVALLLCVLQAKRWKNKKRRPPPGPRAFPVIGNLHLLGETPHRDLHKLAQKHGPIMRMKLGVIQATVISSPEAAKLFLKTHDLVFASRPPHEAAMQISWEQRNLSFAPYGAYWRDVRKLCTLELLSSRKIDAFRGMRRRELGLAVGLLREAGSARMAVDLSAWITSLNADMSCLMVLGKKQSDAEFGGFKAVIQEGMHLAAAPNLGEFLPLLATLDLQGFRKRMKHVRGVFDEFFEKVIEERLLRRGEEGDGGESKDFVDVLLSFMGSQESEYRIERPNVKAILLDMLVGSMDTSATAIEWAIAELIKNPKALHKVQQELEAVVGMTRTVEESDLEKLEYLDMVVKESMRLHPVAPLLIPHAAMEDCVVGGFDIPKNSRLIVNAWAIGRDPGAWSDPEEFVPERFEGSGVDLRGRDFQLIPFGSGRRGCPGIQLGLTVVRLVVAQLAHCFDWELPSGMSASELDMAEEFGLTTPRANPLLVIPAYRLRE